MARLRINKKQVSNIGHERADLVQEAIDKVSKTHAGEPAPKVRSALKKEYKRIDIKPGQNFRDAVKRIVASQSDE